MTRDELFRYADKNWDVLTFDKREELRRMIRGFSTNIEPWPEPDLPLLTTQFKNYVVFRQCDDDYLEELPGGFSSLSALADCMIPYAKPGHYIIEEYQSDGLNPDRLLYVLVTLRPYEEPVVYDSAFNSAFSRAISSDRYFYLERILQ